MTETPDKGNVHAAPITKEEWEELGDIAFRALIAHKVRPKAALEAADRIVQQYVDFWTPIPELVQQWVDANPAHVKPPIPESGETHGERVTEVTTTIPGETLHAEPAIEVYLSSEISERAPTEKRPEPTYGTSSKVAVTLGISFANKIDLPMFLQSLHADQEKAMQEEITRRKSAKATGAGLPGLGNDPDNMDDVPF